jgi:hypothetical protein
MLLGDNIQSKNRVVDWLMWVNRIIIRIFIVHSWQSLLSHSMELEWKKSRPWTGLRATWMQSRSSRSLLKFVSFYPHDCLYISITSPSQMVSDSLSNKASPSVDDLHSPSIYFTSVYHTSYAGFEVFTAVIMKNAVFWYITPYGPCENWYFGGTCHLHHQGQKNQQDRNNVSKILAFLRSVRQLLATYNVVPSSLILFTLMEEIYSSETSLLTRATWLLIPEDGILHITLILADG